MTRTGMENKTLEDHGIETEDFPDEFQCCVCLDLLYKPVVLACGHISCFWCVFKAMDVWQESHCPVCRHPYNHFPSICQLLHFVLLKSYPAAYKRRERQVKEEETEAGCFSPQFDNHLYGLHTSKELNIPGNFLHSTTSPETKLYPKTSSTGEQDPSPLLDSSEITVPDPIIPPATFPGSVEADGNLTMKENSLLGKDLRPGTCKQVSVADLLCVACKNLLFRPVVLNCGHVYCESCIINLLHGIPRCQVCQSMHPYGLPKVCLVLEHLLEEQFSEIYAQRREALLKQDSCEYGSL
ncbi:hypothetical protein L1049_017054 [Liquidambar formosana]|uniref:RING-type domain-containing protein n=1 Tax=Liquidambar formosana TaxID=63359 RepID=A0AAP0X7Y3_LIQFO